MREVAVVDVDLTVVDTAYLWYEWLELKTKAGFSFEWVSQWYDFGVAYGPIWKAKEVSGCPYDYWRSKSLYDGLQPIHGSVDALHQLKLKGFDIVFVSAIKGDHHKSKHNFLKEHFPFMDGFIATKEKGYVGANIVIDDRNKNLNMFDKQDIIKVKMDTKFDQDETLNVSLDYTIRDWEEFEQWLQVNL